MGEIYNIGANFEIAIIQLARELVKMVISFVRFYMATFLPASIKRAPTLFLCLPIGTYLSALKCDQFHVFLSVHCLAKL